MPKPSRALLRMLGENASPSVVEGRTKRAFLEALAAFSTETAAHGLKDDVWIVVITSALVSMNRPAAFGPFWHFCRVQSSSSNSNSISSLFLRASLIRETALKAISCVGIPRVINALGAFTSAVAVMDPQVFELLQTQAPRRGLSARTLQSTLEQGESLWRSEHRPFDVAVTAKLASFHPDLPVYVRQCHYGPLQSDPLNGPTYAAPVGRIASSLIGVATLRSAGQLGPQLSAHIFGTMKAGEEAAKGLVDGIGELGEGVAWLCESEGCQWVMGLCDRVVWALSGEAAGETMELAKL